MGKKGALGHSEQNEDKALRCKELCRKQAEINPSTAASLVQSNRAINTISPVDKSNVAERQVVISLKLLLNVAEIGEAFSLKIEPKNATFSPQICPKSPSHTPTPFANIPHLCYHLHSRATDTPPPLLSPKALHAIQRDFRDKSDKRDNTPKKAHIPLHTPEK
ncbi:MAG: hypothetical protein IJV69_00880 [Kiritimatiellae bacterium]|nr:hypothetical protein [Kiritimatiellia bacterium]